MDFVFVVTNLGQVADWKLVIGRELPLAKLKDSF